MLALFAADHQLHRTCALPCRDLLCGQQVDLPLHPLRVVDVIPVGDDRPTMGLQLFLDLIFQREAGLVDAVVQQRRIQLEWHGSSPLFGAAIGDPPWEDTQVILSIADVNYANLQCWSFLILSVERRGVNVFSIFEGTAYKSINNEIFARKAEVSNTFYHFKAAPY